VSEGLGLKGEFRLLHKIGEGGMADVFLAERMGDDGFRTRVALKRLHRGLAMDSYFIRQLVREARLLGQLEHANIVKVYDLRHIGDEYYVVMEYVDGIDLAAVARVHRRRKTRIPRPFFFHVALSLAEALAYAHSAVDLEGKPTPLIHRDLKPSNVMLSRRGIVKLTDFGIAHVGDGSVTSGLVQGTANYMSPEQAFGDDRLTPASDVYSLGSMFFEMLTGRGLVDADNYLKAIHQVRQRRVTVEELAETGVEPGLRMVIAKMLASDIDQRYQEMESVRNDLQFVADRLKVDLSWHRIRSYVGRLMGILGRAPNRATLSNLKVASEYSPAAASLAPESSAGPLRTEPIPESIDLRKGGGGPVTQAVEKDLLDAPPPQDTPSAVAELVIGDAPASPEPGLGTEETKDVEETVVAVGEQPSASALIKKASPATVAVSLLVEETTALAPSDSWAQGDGEATAIVGAEARIGGAESEEDEERSSSWEVADEEDTRIYGGHSARETGVLGATGAMKTPPPAQRIPTDSVSQLGPTGDLDATAERAPPVAGSGSPGSGAMWVFDDSPSSMSLPVEGGPAPEIDPPPRRRRRKKKRKSTIRILVTGFVIGLIGIFIVLLLVMKKLHIPPFEAPAEGGGAAEFPLDEPLSGLGPAAE
jgi:serine/threonine-protein kinase